MIPKRARMFIAAIAMGVATAPSSASAATIVIGSSTGPAVAQPFGFIDFTPIGSRYQQLYRGDAFGTEPIAISQLAFFVDPPQSIAGHMFYSNQQLFLSTAPTTVGSPGTTFEANRGTDFTEVFFAASRVVGFTGLPFNDNPCSDCTATELVFDIPPFVYDPSAGDLLVEVRGFGVSDEDHVSFQAGPDPAVSRVILGGLFLTDPVVEQGFGLRTRFVFGPAPAPVPEPATLGLAGVALISLLASRSRRL